MEPQTFPNVGISTYAGSSIVDIVPSRANTSNGRSMIIKNFFREKVLYFVSEAYAGKGVKEEIMNKR